MPPPLALLKAAKVFSDTSSRCPALSVTATVTISVECYQLRCARDFIALLPVQMDAAPFIFARAEFIRLARLRAICVRLVELHVRPRSRARTALLVALRGDALSAFRLAADGAAILFADTHDDEAFRAEGIPAPTHVFFGLPSAGDVVYESARRKPAIPFSLADVLQLLDYAAHARACMGAVRALPNVCVSSLDAAEDRFNESFARAMLLLRGEHCEHDAAVACGIYFRRALPREIGSRVIDFAY